MINLIKNVQTIAFTIGECVFGTGESLISVFLRVSIVLAIVLAFLCGVKSSFPLLLPVLLFGLAGYLLYTKYVLGMINSNFVDFSMKKTKTTKVMPQYAVDLPNPYETDSPWIAVDYFDTNKEALKFVQDTYGADEKGRICLVSKLPDEYLDYDEESEPSSVELETTIPIRIINIIEINGGVLSNSTPFIVFDESKVDTVVATAESHFRSLVRKYEDVSEEVMLEFIENGIAELSMNYEILIHWSQTLN